MHVVPFRATEYFSTARIETSNGKGTIMSEDKLGASRPNKVYVQLLSLLASTTQVKLFCNTVSIYKGV